MISIIVIYKYNYVIFEYWFINTIKQLRMVCWNKMIGYFYQYVQSPVNMFSRRFNFFWLYKTYRIQYTIDKIQDTTYTKYKKQDTLDNVTEIATQKSKNRPILCPLGLKIQTFLCPLACLERPWGSLWAPLGAKAEKVRKKGVSRRESLVYSGAHFATFYE